MTGAYRDWRPATPTRVVIGADNRPDAVLERALKLFAPR
jgi:hypothetical protein